MTLGYWVLCGDACCSRRADLMFRSLDAFEEKGSGKY
jgi:hypothetical protein